MVLPDVNVLVAAFRPDHALHEPSREWLRQQVDGTAAFGMSDRILEGFIRVVTHPRVFAEPDSFEDAVGFTDAVVGRGNCVRVEPGEGQWSLFVELAHSTGATGNLIPDAWLAALAIESGLEWITWDEGFARYPGLKWSLPSPAGAH